MSESNRAARADAEEPVPREFLILLNPDQHIQQRVDSRAFQDFVGAVLDAVKQHFAGLQSGPGFDIQVACAVLPGDKLLTEIQTSPPTATAGLVDRLRERLMGLPRPRVRGGPVGFASRDLIRGGCAPSEIAFAFPFSSLAHPGESRPLDDVLMETGGAQSPGSWWASVKQGLGLR
jgi:hypothetical protein